MARRGLPKKYMKMGLKKGWPAYRAAQRKRKRVNSMGQMRTRNDQMAQTKTIVRYVQPKRAPSRRNNNNKSNYNTMGQMRPITMDRAIQQAAEATLNAGVAVGGAMATSAIINALQIQPQNRAFTQMALGLAGSVFSPKGKRFDLMRAAGYGATVAGALSLARTMIPQFAPLLMGQTSNIRNIRRVPAARVPAMQKTPAEMGMKARFSGDHNMGMQANFSGKGTAGQYLTSADF